MKIHAKINFKSIIILVLLLFVISFVTCYTPEILKIGVWDEGVWDQDAWGE